MGIFGPLIVAYLFLGGTGGGALAVLSLLEVANSPRIASRRWLLPSEFFARAWAACVVVLGIAVVCLLADLGRPDRAVSLFTAPELTPIAVGAWALAAALAIATTFAAANLLEAGLLRKRIAVAGGVAGAAIGCIVVAYTGVLLYGAASVLAWQTPLVVALFIVSGASCGIALCLGSAAFVESRAPLIRPVRALARVDSLVIALEASCIALYVAWLAHAQGTQPAADALIAGRLRWLFWLAIVVLGLAVPFVMERFITYSNSRSQLLWVALCVLVGGLALRAAVVDVSAFDATQALSLASMLASAF